MGRWRLRRPQGGAASRARYCSRGKPVADASVLVATRTGTPFSARTDATGHYRIENIPPGQYVPAAVAPSFEETALSGAFGIPYLVTVRAGETVHAPCSHPATASAPPPARASA